MNILSLYFPERFGLDLATLGLVFFGTPDFAPPSLRALLEEGVGVAAVVTPPDAISQLLLAVPMCLLFEFGLILARLMDRFLGKHGAKADDEADRPSDPAKAEQERLQ